MKDPEYQITAACPSSLDYTHLPKHWATRGVRCGEGERQIGAHTGCPLTEIYTVQAQERLFVISTILYLLDYSLISVKLENACESITHCE